LGRLILRLILVKPDEQGEDIDEELEKLFSHMVAEIELKSRKDYENKSHKNCFLSSQLIDWAMKNSHQPMDRAQGTSFMAASRLEPHHSMYACVVNVWVQLLSWQRS